jgi:uncharacterized protein DUF669
MRFTVEERKLLPDGDYDFYVEDAKAKTANSGRDMIEIKLSITDGKGNKTFLYDRLMSWNLAAFLASIGEEVVYGEVDIEPYDLVHRTGRVRLGHEEYEGEERNKIVKYLPALAKPSSAAILTHRDPERDDEIPF